MHPLTWFIINFGSAIFAITYTVSYLVIMKKSIINCFGSNSNCEVDIDRITLFTIILSLIIVSVIGFYNFKILWNNREMISIGEILFCIMFNVSTAAFCLFATHPRTGCFSPRVVREARMKDEEEWSRYNSRKKAIQKIMTRKRCKPIPAEDIRIHPNGKNNDESVRLRIQDSF